LFDFEPVIDEEFRSSKVYRHQIGTNHSMDELLWHERDQSVFADVTRTKDNRFALITLNSKSMSEVWTIDTDQPNPKPVLVRSRSAGLEYFVEHAGNGVLVMVTNADGARNYKLVVASVENPGQWFDLLPQDSNGARISEIDVLQNHLIVWQQCDGIPRVRLVSWPASNRVPTFTSLAALPHFDIPLPAGTQVVRGGFNAIDSSAVRLICSSVLESDAVYDFDLQKHTLSRCFGDDDTQKTVVKRAGGSYVCERVNVKSDDGALVPMTSVRRHDAKPNSEYNCVSSALVLSSAN
jgi:oligopeptidase B